MRATFYAKCFFLCTLLTIVVLLYISVKDIRNAHQDFLISHRIIEMERTFTELSQQLKVNKVTQDERNSKIQEKELPMKYILQWTSAIHVPFVYMGKGRKGFTDRNCLYTNCYVTSDRSYLGDYTKFDLIVFAGPDVVHMYGNSLPIKRSPHQKFAFASIESADNYPVCSNRLDGFFNWTFTYKLDSEAKWGYIVIRDSEKKVIGPKKEMHWIKLEEMDPISKELKEQLKTKTKAAAWFVSNCYTRSHRETFVKELQEHLKKFDLTVDVYGNCGPLKCSRDESADCSKMIEKDYYFYLSFENSFSEDYVTEKLLHGLKNNAVPVVFGGANYTRFMPDGIYLNARELGAQDLAAKMNELIKDKDKYYEYFKWKKYYSYYRRVESIETDDYCRFCSILNEEDLVNETTVYQNFQKWWDPPNRC